MRQTQARTRFSALALVGAILLFCLIPAMAGAQSAAFQDLPKDHWAYKDIDFLIKSGYMEGYPDGTFKGRKVITRYDMALVLARVLRQIEGTKTSENEATETERAALSRLTKEFRDELGLLGVRVDGLERRMSDAESKMANLENALPKVKVSGFYRALGQYVIEPESVLRDEEGDEIEAKYMYTKPGMVTFYQKMYLRFTGKPLGDKIETFYELLGYVSGKTANKLIYNDVGRSGTNPFDAIDDYVTKIQNDRYAQTNKVHFISNAKSMKVRVFAGESITGIDDPLNSLTEDSDVVYPYQGVEFSGTDNGLNYQASALKNDVRDVTTDTKEILSGRMVWKLPSKFSPDSFSVGTTYAERINDFKVRGNSNTVRGADVNYTTERVGKVQATAEFLTSTDYHEDTSDGKDKSLGDEATKMDISVQNGGFTGTVKHYDFGKDFRARLAPIWAYDIGDEDGDSDYPDDPIFKDNYGHEGFYGEKLTRFSANYDFGNKLLSIAKNLSMEATYLTKTWEVDPFKAQKTDGYSGRKFTYQILSDFTDNTTLKYDYEQKLDALADESGMIRNTVELDLKLNDSVSSKAKVDVSTDHDDKHVVGGTTYKRNDRSGYFEINSNINPRVFAKGSVEHQVEWVNTPEKENTRIDYIGETTYNLTPTTSLTGGVQHIDFEHRGDTAKSSLANAILAELKKNFTDKFRGRAFYTRGVVDYKNGLKDMVDRENLYGELIYDISKDAVIKLKFGYDYPDKWRWDVTSTDNGRDWEDIETQKMLTFEARANF